MPYGSRSAHISSAVSFNPSSPIMSFSRLGVRTSMFQDPGHRLRNEIKMINGYPYCPSQKEILMNLNDRLAAYLERVKTLEVSNQQLELKIKELSEKRMVARDNSRYHKTISELKSQIQRTKVLNSELWLNMENTKTAADGFKAKYEAELALRHSIAADVKKLKDNSSDLDMEKRCLEVELQILGDELENLKKDLNERRNHHLHEKSRCQVNVEVDSSTAIDLPKALEKMREQYKEITDYYQKASGALNKHKYKEVTHLSRVGTNFFYSHTGELSMLRRKVQDLKVEIEVLYSMKSVGEAALFETESGYATQLEKIQEAMLKIEDELAIIKSEAESLNSDSRLLYYLKDLLEMEIRTYRMLMDEEDNRMQDVIGESSCEIPNNRHKSFSVITKNPPVEDLTSGHTTHGGLSGF
ncbi:keratin, type I cytoskeletal 15-like isoform X2 [Pseudophryne corroboree]|uniref:keratin, type I cytoskeletal 15-like isoform X2 n=1 Tax=Pseudophryne corroboree TaxID=495146 RepID=UPI0030821CF0